MSSSTSVNPTPFFGSKISLISKSEIRYEGFLYSVDATESTITLSEVRSYGSENRSVKKPIPPHNEIFELIIFKASDIKDLIVDHPPSPALTDPAIIQVHSTASQGQFPSSFSQPAGTNTAAGQPAAAGASSTSLQQQLQQAGIQNAAVATSMGKTSTDGQMPGNSGPAQDNSKTKPATTGVQVVSMNSGQSQGSKNSGAKQLPQRNANQMNRQQGSGSGSASASHANNNRQDGGGSNNADGFANRNNFNRRFNTMNRGGGQMNGFQQRNGAMSGQGFQRTSFSNRFHNQHAGHGGHRPGANIGGFSSYNRRQNNRNFVSNRSGGVGGHQKTTLNLPDFDFEKAQDEFKQLEEKMATLKVNGDVSASGGAGSDAENSTANSEQSTTKTEIDAVSNDPCYNKEKSFFDKISCESLERAKGNVQRVDWRAERKLNLETFGVMAPMRRNNGFHRPNQRFSGGGGGGGYRNYQQNYRSRSGQRSSNQSNQNGGGAAANQTSNSSSTAAATSTAPVGTTASTVASASNLVSPAKN